MNKATITKFAKKLKKPNSFLDFVEELGSRGIKITSIKKAGNKTTIGGRIYQEYEASLDDGYELLIKIDNKGVIQSLIYDEQVILDIDDPVVNLRKKAREIAKLSINKRLREAKKKDTKANKAVSKIVGTNDEDLQARKAQLEKEIAELKEKLYKEVA